MEKLTIYGKYNILQNIISSIRNHNTYENFKIDEIVTDDAIKVIPNADNTTLLKILFKNESYVIMNVLKDPDRIFINITPVESGKITQKQNNIVLNAFKDEIINNNNYIKEHMDNLKLEQGRV